MHKAGWVHRDVSSGNILIEDNDECRISDLEYAKPFGSGEEFRIVRVISFSWILRY